METLASQIEWRVNRAALFTPYSAASRSWEYAFGSDAIHHVPADQCGGQFQVYLHPSRVEGKLVMGLIYSMDWVANDVEFDVMWTAWSDLVPGNVVRTVATIRDWGGEVNEDTAVTMEFPISLTDLEAHMEEKGDAFVTFSFAVVRMECQKINNHVWPKTPSGRPVPQ
jgi:hypothetical protein